MKKITKLFIFLIIILFITNTLNINSLTKKNWLKEKDKAERLYKLRKYDEAVILFREIILSSGDDKLIREMYFWLAKAYMDSGKLEQAEKNIEYYISNYKTNGLNVPEAYYQKGRLLFLQEQYQDSISQLNYFIKQYPFHKLISNAYYWIGECLYALGQFEDSSYFFHIVIKKYPGSVKKEASSYKLRLIEHKKSELALQNLLKWSQEQYISALNQFRITEKTLQEILQKYKEGKSVIDQETLEKYKEIEKQNQLLVDKITSLEEQIKQLEGNLSNEDLLEKMRQLELKEELLKNKEDALKILEEELRRKEEALE